ncbi:MAG TPA: hypothetical protein VFX59_30940 [Polyangiales bacterium]|nr:hypothetical protein [Polyangiales bacterium]
MTTRTIFPLLLAVAGLTVGCQDREPGSKATPKIEAPKVEAPKLEELTALAPPAPTTIAELKGDDEPKKPKLEEELVITHDSEPEQMFDRPVDAKDVVIDRFVLARDVAGKEPVEESDHFSSDTAKIFAFVQLANEDEPFAVTVHFEPVDGPSALYGVKLDVPTAPRWRTWAWTKLVHTPGKYRAVLRTLEGEEISAREFTIDEDVK